MKSKHKNKKLIIKFMKAQWLSLDIKNCLDLKQNNSNIGMQDYQDKLNLENSEKLMIVNFLNELPDPKYLNGSLTADLIEIPNTIYLGAKFLKSLEKPENEKIYETLLANNDILSYKSAIIGLLSSKNNINFETSNSQERNYLSIFVHALAMAPSFKIQTKFEKLYIDYKIEGIEYVRKMLFYELCEASLFGNSNIDLIIFNLIEFTAIPYRAIETVIEYVNKTKIVTK